MPDLVTHRQTPRAIDVPGLDTESLREAFLVESAFTDGANQFTFTDLDRLVVAGIVPRPSFTLPDLTETGRQSFHEMRESGFINLGGKGSIEVDGQRFAMDKLDCLYVSLGAKSVTFTSDDADHPARFFMLSCPAHRAFPTAHAKPAQANILSLGDQKTANVRKIHQFIHEGGIKSCQLVMGFTTLAEGSVWNTFPPHTHLRRSEIYCYFDLQGPLVMHFMGEPHETRNLVMREKDIVLSPPWSIHSGCGAGAYSFIWGMAGENQAFADMDAVDLKELL